MKIGIEKVGKSEWAFQPNGLTIFAGQNNEIYQFLVAGMLSEHITNPRGVRTLMIHKDMDPADVLPYANESGVIASDVIAIESLATAKMLALVLTLLKRRFRVWAGVESLSKEGALDFLRTLVCSQSLAQSQSLEDEWGSLMASHGSFEVRDCSASRLPTAKNRSQLLV